MAASPHACSQFLWDLTVEADGQGGWREDGGGLYRASHWEGKKRPGVNSIKLFTSEGIVLGSKNNSYSCKLHFKSFITCKLTPNACLLF